MFVLVVVQDIITIPPMDFGEEREAIVFQINKKYANRVIANCGLVIKVHDILYVSSGMVYPGEGSSHVTVKFRVVVFRPFVGEVLYGWIGRSSAEGIEVSMKFFEHTIILPEELQDPASYDSNAGVWCWENEGSNFWLEPESKIRFVVLSVTFNPIRDEKPKAPEEGVPIDETWSPMVIHGTIKGYGLGIIDWWQAEEAKEADELAERMEIKEEVIEPTQATNDISGALPLITSEANEQLTKAELNLDLGLGEEDEMGEEEILAELDKADDDDVKEEDLF